MSYGLTLDQVREIHHPAPVHAAWGSIIACTQMPQYGLYRIVLSTEAAQPLHFHPSGPYQLFVENGEVIVRLIDQDGRASAGIVQAGTLLPLPLYSVYSLASREGGTVYIFGPHSREGLQSFSIETQDAAINAASSLFSARLENIGQPTTDVREKYWGRIETILSSDVAGKRILVRKGGQSSLEFHVEKRETYYIHSGLLKIGLRIGRAENHSIVLKPGDSYDVSPGVMHMRMALEDTIIIEASTRDSDADSYLVEDGQTYRHIEIDSNPSLTEKQEQPA
jgi:mannose-6-phosphate isomerase-like protein (cupin superfamily)